MQGIGQVNQHQQWGRNSALPILGKDRHYLVSQQKPLGGWVPPQLTDMKPKTGKGKPMEETEAGRWQGSGTSMGCNRKQSSSLSWLWVTGSAGLVGWRLQCPFAPPPSPKPCISWGTKICPPGCMVTLSKQENSKSIDIRPEIHAGTSKYLNIYKYSPLSISHANEMGRQSEIHRRKLRLQKCVLGILDLFWFSSTNQQEVWSSIFLQIMKLQLREVS